MKKYKTWEVIKMMEENENLEFKNDSHVIGVSILGYLKVKKSKCETLTLDGNIKLNSKWELVKQPVTFEEVLNSDKHCTVEHGILEDEPVEFGLLSDVMEELASTLTNDDLKRVMRDGNWYLED